jgi:hypothetical protein
MYVIIAEPPGIHVGEGVVQQTARTVAELSVHLLWLVSEGAANQIYETHVLLNSP